MAELHFRSNPVVQGLSHTWLLSFIPNEQTTTSGVVRKGKAPRTKRKAEQTLLHTHVHSHMWVKHRLRSLKGKALSVQITAHHSHCPMTSFSAAPILNWWSVLRSEVRSFKRITFRQTGYYTAWLLRQYYAKEESRNDTPLFFHSEETVEKHKCCLWFKAQKGYRALCLLSALQLKCKAVQMKGPLKGYLSIALCTKRQYRKCLSYHIYLSRLHSLYE